jgi:hypothetical protein
MSTSTKPNSRKEYREQCKRENVNFLQDMQGRTMVQYLRSPGRFDYPTFRQAMKLPPFYHRGDPKGVMVAYRDALGHVRFGFSFKHSKLERVFDKAVGLRKAIERAEVHQTTDEKPYEIPSRYQKQINTFMSRATERLTENGQD